MSRTAIAAFGYEFTKMLRRVLFLKVIADQWAGVYALPSGYEMIRFEIKVLPPPLYPK